MGCQGAGRWTTMPGMSASKSKTPKTSKPKTPNHGAKLKAPTANPDHARRIQTPALEDPDIEARLDDLVKPAVFAQLHHYNRLGMRHRILSLPVMVSLVLTLMWRNIPSVRTLVRMMREERLLWTAPIQVSQPALSERFLPFPAELFASVFEAVAEQLPTRVAARPATRPVPVMLSAISKRFPALYALD